MMVRVSNLLKIDSDYSQKRHCRWLSLQTLFFALIYLDDLSSRAFHWPFFPLSPFLCSSSRLLRPFKALRVLRIFKAFSYVKSLKRIGEVLLEAFSSFLSVALLMSLFIVIFAIIGLQVRISWCVPHFEIAIISPLCRCSQVFGTTRPLPPLGQIGRPGTASEIEELQRARFGTFWQAILTVFQVMTVEDWELVMYGFVRAQGYGSTLYFLIWVIISKYTFLTLFLAVTLEVFEHKYKTEIISKQRVGRAPWKIDISVGMCVRFYIHISSNGD